MNTSGTLTSPADVTITASNGGTVAETTITVYPLNTLFATGVAFFAPPTISANGGTYLNLATACINANAPSGVTVALGGSRPNIVDIYGVDSNNQETLGSTYIAPGHNCAAISFHTFPFTGIDHRTSVSVTLNGITRSALLTITAQPQARLKRHDSIQCAAFATSGCLPAISATQPSPLAVGDSAGYYLYTPELRLLGETEVNSGSTKQLAYSYLWFGNLPVAEVETSTNATRWYATDHLSTPYAMTDATGTLVWRAEYAPYGTVFTTRTGAAIHQPLRFPGQIAQDGTDTYYNVFRHYRSTWGRYTQADPIGLDGGHDLYAYVLANPLLNVDLLGLKCCKPKRITARRVPRQGGVGQVFGIAHTVCAEVDNSSRCEFKQTIAETAVYWGGLWQSVNQWTEDYSKGLAASYVTRSSKNTICLRDNGVGVGNLSASDFPFIFDGSVAATVYDPADASDYLTGSWTVSVRCNSPTNCHFASKGI